MNQTTKTLLPCIFNVYFDTIVPSKLRASKLSLLDFFVGVIGVSNVCYMLYQLILLVIVLVKHKVMNFLVSTSYLFHRPIYISGNVKIMYQSLCKFFQCFLNTSCVEFRIRVFCVWHTFLRMRDQVTHPKKICKIFALVS
jgi:hypothetical protein